MPLTPGTKLDGYEILGPLGAGGMGEVYRACDPVLKREVAIKVLPAYFSQDPVRLRRFEQEAQAAAALNHPNILAVYRFGTCEGAPYLASELLEGGTLGQLLARGPLPARKAIDYGVQIWLGPRSVEVVGVRTWSLYWLPNEVNPSCISTLVTLSPGVFQVTMPRPVTLHSRGEQVNESLTEKPKLIVQASVVPL